MGVPLPIDSWLARGIAAYRVGGHKPVTMSDGPSGELFRSRAQALIRSRLADDPHNQYIAIRDGVRAAVTTARRSAYADAAAEFQQIEESLAALRPTEEVRLLARSWIDQAYAYLAVRMRDWDTARARLTAAMAADLALEDGFGYDDFFHIGRVHTVHLWMRAQGEAGDRAGAVVLGQQILDYVQGHAADLPVGSAWSAARAAAVPGDLRLAMTLRVCSEIGTQASIEPPAAAGFTAWRAWADHPVLREVHAWAEAHRAWLDGDTRGFLSRAEPILLAGRRETTLWYATACAFSRVCAELRPAATRVFLDDVRADVAAWRQLPQDVQAPALFAHMAAPAEAPAAQYRHRESARRFHIFTVGLPRTGTTSLYTLFENFRAGNEFMERETVSRVTQAHTGQTTQEALAAYLRRRSAEADLELDSASFHHLYLDFLLDEFPGARYICTIRSPYDWANSYLKMIMGWHRRFTDSGDPLPEWMEDYGRMLFGDFSWSWVASRDSVAERAAPLADAFVRHWAEANRRVLGKLPEGRSIVIRTEALSNSQPALARFAGVPLDMLTDRHHSNAHPDRGDLLQGLGRPWVEARAAEYGADVLAAAGIILDTAPGLARVEAGRA